MKIEIYSRTPLFGRTQWRWRAVHRNGNIMATSGESYNNREDLDEALETLRALFPKARTVVVSR